MTKLSNVSEQIKSKMKADYLAGMSLASIARKYDLADRSSIYYYIGKLTPMEKAAHTENRSRREDQQRNAN